MVVFRYVILERLNKVSVQIQSSSVDVLAVSDLYKSILNFMAAERENFDYFEEIAIQMSAFEQYQGDIKSKRRHKKKIADEYETSDVDIEKTSRDSFNRS